MLFKLNANHIWMFQFLHVQHKTQISALESQCPQKIDLHPRWSRQHDIRESHERRYTYFFQ